MAKIRFYNIGKQDAFVYAKVQVGSRRRGVKQVLSTEYPGTYPLEGEVRKNLLSFAQEVIPPKLGLDELQGAK